MFIDTNPFSISALEQYARQSIQERSAVALSVFNPGTGEQLGSLPAVSKEQLGVCHQKAHNAFVGWSQTTTFQRSEKLHRLADLMKEHHTSLAKLISLENGKPFSESAGEVTYSIGFFRWFANSIVQLQGYVPSSNPKMKIEVHHKPVGVCAAITPWNFPLAMLAKKCAAALAAGCAMLCKPADETPFSAIALMRLIEMAEFPSGIVQICVGDAPMIGEYFCTQRNIRKLSFTGSTDVGRILMRQSSHNLQKLSMELGGNAPFIVLNSADIDTVCTGMLRSKFRNSGQACISANRFIIAESRYDEVLSMLTSQAKSLSVGPAFDKGDGISHNDIGPLISLKAVHKLHHLLTDAIGNGAKLHWGSLPNVDNQFVDPIIVTGITPEMDLWWEELFGPVIACAKAKDTEDAIQLANQSNHGLGAYLFTQNPSEIELLPSQIECGMVGVNTGAISMPHTPFGGVKYSGFGREGGIEGLFEYLTTQTVVRQF